MAIDLKIGAPPKDSVALLPPRKQEPHPKPVQPSVGVRNSGEEGNLSPYRTVLGCSSVRETD